MDRKHLAGTPSRAPGPPCARTHRSSLHIPEEENFIGNWGLSNPVDLLFICMENV